MRFSVLAGMSLSGCFTVVRPFLVGCRITNIKIFVNHNSECFLCAAGAENDGEASFLSALQRQKRITKAAVSGDSILHILNNS